MPRKDEIAIRNADIREGREYQNRGGGSFFCCGRIPHEGHPARMQYKMVNMKSGWTFWAHNITVYKDGTIEWDYSSDGYFGEVPHEASV